MHEVEGGELLVRALEDRGVERVFSVSGGPINSIYAAADRAEGMQLHHVRHEGAAGFMADAVSRLTDVPGVAVVTLGPGVTNVITPIATAALAGTPMFVVGGQAPIGNDHRGAGMQIEVLPLVAPLVKFSARISDAGRIPEYVDLAWRHMLAGQPGPVYLEIPANVLNATAESSMPRSAALPPLPADQTVLHQMADALAQAARPVVILGDDVRWHSVPAARLVEFAERFDVPVALSRLARGAMPETDERCLGPGYTPCNPALLDALAASDCILLVGHTFDFDLDFGSTTSPDAKILQTHRAAELIGKNRPADLGMTASAGSVIDGLLPLAATGAREEGWSRSVCSAWQQHRRELLTTAAAREGDAMHPLVVVDEVARSAPEGTTFVTSHGNIDFWADAHLQPSAPTRYLRAGQAGALGAEVPYGVASGLVNKGAPTIVFVGDGGFGYHALELDTAVRYGSRVIVVVADDQKWGAISEPQRGAYGVEVEMDLPRRDWAAFARSLGASGERADTPDEVADAVKRAADRDGPSVIHVPIQTDLSPYMQYIS